MGINTNIIRQDFTILKKDIIYFDSACVSLKPKQVVDAINSYYNEFPGCGSRSSHKFGREVTEQVELTRRKIAKFFGARRSEEIIFTRNTTEGINLVAQTYPFKKGDKIIISDKEHNSNLIPWQELKKKKGIILEIFKFGDIESFKEKIKGARLASFVQTSNLDGTTQNVQEMIKIAHKEGAKVLIDGAQSAPHKEINLKKLDTDFFVASGHKMLGPSGTGILYGKKEELEKLELFISGGETVKDSQYNSYVIEDIPQRFEAGLQNYAGIIGLGAAIDYLKKIGMNNIQKKETELNKKLTQELLKIKGLKIIGPENAEERGGVISFNIEGINPHDIALQLDASSNIMIRSGYHCCHSWFNSHKIDGSARASLYFYNTTEEIDKFLEALEKALKILK